MLRFEFVYADALRQNKGQFESTSPNESSLQIPDENDL